MVSTWFGQKTLISTQIQPSLLFPKKIVTNGLGRTLKVTLDQNSKHFFKVHTEQAM